MILIKAPNRTAADLHMVLDHGWSRATVNGYRGWRSPDGKEAIFAANDRIEKLDFERVEVVS
ncbi:hypothetical protein [Thalassospira povalilytica]|uniref:hypothetical protein n=1 Tax=Thalassospira povalilytica TaxID=732237 RepID=UPI003AA9A937